MQINDFRLTVAGNLIALRTKCGLTQAELGAKLNYSDKSISKWERGESVPDAYTLTKLAEIYGVSVDYILSDHDGVEAPAGMPVGTDEPKYSAAIIIAIAALSIMTSALTAFVILWLFEIIYWQVFLVGLSLTLLTTTVLYSVFYRGRTLQYLISAFVLSLFVLAYFMLPGQKPWQLFLIAVPAIGIVFLACNVRIKPKIPKINLKNKKKSADSTESRV